MGSSGEPNTKRIDATVGGLVWVRRRNGSWWPGRIMGLDELSEGCLVSPRSGTPVKLLGREDASVDWYNLEKSKRVKAFRCGDYDDCIEKAKAAANSNKKAVKYARREDAILHALELENTRFGRDQPDLCLRSKGSGGEDGGWARDSPTMSHSADETDDSEEVSDSEDSSSSAQELSQSGISFQEPNNISVPKVESVRGRRRRTPNDSEDDGIEGTKRMRGLEDLGMGVVSKRKIQSGGVLEQLQQDNALLGDSTNGKYMSVGTGSPTNGSKGHFLSLKRKRTQVAHVHEFLKRKNRRRPLTKVLESTAMVSVPVMCDELVSPCGSPLNGVSDSKVSGLESNESKKTFSVINNSSDSTGVSFENGVSLNASEHACDASHNHKLKENEISCMSGFLDDDSSDKLFDVPFVGEEKHSAGFSHIFALSSRKPQVSTLGRESNQGSQVETIILRNEGLHESGSTSSVAVHNITQRMEKGTSKWQSKGKRNSRHMNRSIRHDLRSSVDADDESDGYLAGMEHLDGFSVESDMKGDSSLGVGSLTSDSLGLNAKSKTFREDQANGFPDWHKRADFTDAALVPQRSLPYRQSRFTVHPKYQMADFPTRNLRAECTLYDVNLEVQASYRPQHVPLVSLMSKLNGKAIIGHPLTVEVMEGGTTDQLIDNIEWYPTSSTSALHDTLIENDELGYVDAPNSEAVRVPTKHLMLQPRSSPSKSPKTKKSGLLLKKTRKLSSLTSCHKLREEKKPLVENLKGPAIACIPLKVVFSRLNEAVTGSARPMHRALVSSNP